MNAYVAQYKEERAVHEAAIKKLYEQRDAAFEQGRLTEVKKINTRIDTTVEQWNEDWPKGPTYLDLHWMTSRGALDYVARMAEGSGTKWLLETGRGNHSPDNEPVIKKKLLEEYGERISEHWFNKGKLILDMS